MRKRIIIRNSDIQALENCSPATATRRLQLTKILLNKKKWQPVTIREYAHVMDMDEEEILNNLYL